MRRILVTAALLLSPLFAFGAACPNGVPLLEFQLVVEPAGGGVGHAVRTVNRIEAKQRLIYAPVVRSPEELKDSEVALALVPPNSGTRLAVLQPKPAGGLAEWEVPVRTSVLAFVYGPQGLDAKRITSLVTKDRQFIEQLADYAEQTARTENLIAALANWDRTPTATENLNAALAGFSTGYGGAVKLDRNASPEQQMAVLVRTLNPALATIDPFATEPRKRMQQSALLASSVAGLFFGNPVSLAASGAAMFVNLSDMIFPDTEFRSAFVQPASAYSGMLCANRDRPKSRTRMAYLWAVRVPDAEPPSLSFDGTAHVLIGARTPAKLNVENREGWKYLDRAADWTLLASDSDVRIPVKVSVRPESQTLEIDLKQTAAKPGAYKLAASWDWQRFEVAGEIQLHQLHEAHQPQIAAETRDLLIASTGRVPVSIRGFDFEFLEKLELKGTGRQGDHTTALAFNLPDGPRAGPQFEVQSSIDTETLQPGSYRVILYFPEGITRELPVRILPPHPVLESLPLRVNIGESKQQIALQGSGLDRIERITSSKAAIELDGHLANGMRAAIVKLNAGAGKGERLDAALKVEGVEAPIEIPKALEVIGPRPRITSVQVSLPGDLGMQLAEGELPVGSFASFSVRAHPLESPPAVHVACVEPALTLRPATVRLGEEQGGVRMQSAGSGALFLSLDPGSIGRPGCTVSAVISTDAQGSSDRYELGRVVRLPRIDAFELTDKKQGEIGYAAVLKGEDLEVIERVGWDARFGLPVTDLPVPFAAGGRKQSLKVTIPWPSPMPHAPVYVWLRGEREGRATSARY